MKQHYVPQFLLKSWAKNNDDNKLEVFTIDLKNIVSSRLTPEYTGYEDDLFAFDHESVRGIDKQFNETRLFKYIDNHGARVLQKIKFKGLKLLTDKDKNDWALFIMSLFNRQPKFINQLKIDGTKIIQLKLNENPEEYDEISSVNDPDKLEQFVEKEYPGLIENFGLYTLKDLINNSKIGTKILNFKWFYLEFKNTPIEIILSDNPCILINGIDDENCVLALPISPNSVFFATKSLQNKKRILKSNNRNLIKRLNQSSINQAKNRVYATTKVPSYNFIKNHLIKSKSMGKNK
ncbi:MAG: DUF4238 domain-containing protein [Marinicellaceae bacterium]